MHLVIQGRGKRGYIIDATLRGNLTKFYQCLPNETFLEYYNFYNGTKSSIATANTMVISNQRDGGYLTDKRCKRSGFPTFTVTVDSPPFRQIGFFYDGEMSELFHEISLISPFYFYNHDGDIVEAGCNTYTPNKFILNTFSYHCANKITLTRNEIDELTKNSSALFKISPKETDYKLQLISDLNGAEPTEIGTVYVGLNKNSGNIEYKLLSNAQYTLRLMSELNGAKPTKQNILYVNFRQCKNPMIEYMMLNRNEQIISGMITLDQLKKYKASILRPTNRAQFIEIQSAILSAVAENGDIPSMDENVISNLITPEQLQRHKAYMPSANDLTQFNAIKSAILGELTNRCHIIQMCIVQTPQVIDAMSKQPNKCVFYFKCLEVEFCQQLERNFPEQCATDKSFKSILHALSSLNFAVVLRKMVCKSELNEYTIAWFKLLYLDIPLRETILQNNSIHDNNAFDLALEYSNVGIVPFLVSFGFQPSKQVAFIIHQDSCEPRPSSTLMPANSLYVPMYKQYLDATNVQPSQATTTVTNACESELVASFEQEQSQSISSDCKDKFGHGS